MGKFGEFLGKVLDPAGVFGRRDREKADYFNRTHKVSSRAEKRVLARGRRTIINPLRKQLADFKGPEALRMEANAPTGPLAEFEAIRRRAIAQARTQGQENENALMRRLSAAGALNSGAGIKLLQQQKERDQEAVRGSTENIDFQEAQQRMARDEAIAGRNFQRELKNSDDAFRTSVFKFDAASKLGQLDLQLQQFAMAKGEQAFNKRIAELEDKRSGGLFGGGGFLGLGG